MAEIILTEENFESEVLGCDKPVLIDFFATWCGPCKMLAPTIEELAQEYEGIAKICKADVDAAPGLAEKFGVMSIPTLVTMKGGEVVETSVGYKKKEDIELMINRAK